MFAFTPSFYDELASRLFVLLEKQLLSVSKAATVTNDAETVLTVADAAKKLKLCSKTILNRIDSGLLPATNYGTVQRPQWRISPADLNAFRTAHGTRKR